MQTKVCTLRGVTKNMLVKCFFELLFQRMYQDRLFYLFDKVDCTLEYRRRRSDVAMQICSNVTCAFEHANIDSFKHSNENQDESLFRLF